MLGPEEHDLVNVSQTGHLKRKIFHTLARLRLEVLHLAGMLREGLKTEGLFGASTKMMLILQGPPLVVVMNTGLFPPHFWESPRRS